MNPDLSAMDPRTRRLINGVIFVMVLAIIAAIAIGIISRRPKGITFTIAFKDARGLALGAPVMLQGFRVGEVTRVALVKEVSGVEVDAAIAPNYVDQVPAPEFLTARIKKPLLLPGGGEVVLIRLKNAKGQMPDGARIDGVEGLTGEMRFRAKGAIKRAYAKTAEKTSDTIDRFRTWWAEKRDKKQGAGKARKELDAWLNDLENLDYPPTPTESRTLRARGELLQKSWEAQKLDEEAREMGKMLQSVEEYEKAAADEEKGG